MLMTKKKANRLIMKAYDEGNTRGYLTGHDIGHERGYDAGYHEGYEDRLHEGQAKRKHKTIDVCIGEDKVREVIDKTNNENKRYRYF